MITTQLGTPLATVGRCCRCSLSWFVFKSSDVRLQLEPMLPHLAIISTSLAGAYRARVAPDNRWAVFEEWLMSLAH